MKRYLLCALLLAIAAGAPAQDAINELKVRADAGDRTATRQLAEAYYIGRGVEQDNKQAAFWYEKLAKQGDVRAQTTLGLLYFRGVGLERNYELAYKWWSLAAARDPAAQFNLGNLFFEGKGVPVDPAKAAEWYAAAARKGHVQAQHDLGMLYYQGAGVTRDVPRAYMWVQVAALQGDERAELSLKRIAADMTPAQIAEAKGLANEWISRLKKQLR
ncbi:MAG: tetratricopeptide repeat protein [Burkholderiales bacterium]